MADKPHITPEDFVTRLVQVGVWATPQNPIQYAFLEQKPAYLPNEPGWTILSAAQRTAVERAFAMIAEVVNLTFVQVPDNQQQPGAGNRRINFYANSVDLAFSGSMNPYQSPGSDAINGADIRFNTARIAQRQTNEHWQDFAPFVALHEALHAVGLSHPGNYNGQGFNYQDHAEFVEDTIQYSVMSYFSAAQTGADHFIDNVQYAARTPLLYDILALQSLYAPNMTTRAGDTVYGFNSNTGANSPFNFAVTVGPIVAIWDGGGIDTIDLSGYSDGSLINLTAGEFSDAGGLTKNIAIAFGVTIENAVGGAGDDVIHGNSAANQLAGGAGNDQLDGREGADLLDGGAGADQMNGGAGDDIYYVDSLGDVVAEQSGEGNDEVRTGLAAYSLAANFEKLTGLSGAGQSLTGNGLANVITGGSGNDLLDGGAGIDTLIGGAGNDVYIIDDISDFVTELADQGIDEMRSSASVTTIRNNVENLVGTSQFGQQLFGNTLDNRIDGGVGNDMINGHIGADIMAGHGGNDFYIVDNVGDVVIELANEGDSDRVLTHLAAWTLGENIENLTGEAIIGQILTGNDLANVIIGGLGDDTLAGGLGNDTLNGNGSNDILDGGAGSDTMVGGGGDDIYLVDDGGDVVIEFATTGEDEVRTALASYTLADHVELLTGTSGSGQILTGNGGGNIIFGGSGDDVLDGGAGIDSLRGGLGNDVYLVDNSGDSVLEFVGEGIDEVRTALASFGLQSFGLENLTGTSSGGQTLLGSAADNIILAGSGSDVIDGGFGADDMRGGTGDDIYFVDQAGDSISELAGGGTDEVRTVMTAYVLAGNVENLTAIAFAGQSLTGNELANIITGGIFDDVLDGGSGADQLIGGTGDDIYYLDDAGDGITELAGQGTDEIRTLLASGSLAFLPNFENITGLGNIDQTLTGNGGDNVIDGGLGADQMNGGAGNDIFLVDNAGDTIGENAGEGSDEVRTALASYSIAGMANVELLTGTGFVDQSLTGNAGDNIINGGAGSDVMTGGLGNDIYYLDSFGDVVVENGAEGIDEIGTSLNGFNLLTTPDVERLVAIGDDAHGFRGNAADNVIVGAGGADQLSLQDGGNDIVDGGGGNDIIYFGATLDPVDRVDGGAGLRDVLVLQGNYNLAVPAATMTGIEFLSLQSGSITRFGDVANNLYDYNLTLTDASVEAGVQLVVNAQSLLAGEDLTFDGSGESDGRFLVYGGHGVDTMKGGAGNDIFFFEGIRFGPSDAVDGGGGRDSLVIAGVNGLNHIEFGETALTSIESISVNNRFATDPSAVPIYDLVLRDGNVASGVTMTINASSLGPGQTVNVDAHLELDGSFNMFGGGGADTFVGGANGDLIYAAGGADTLTGGNGGDTFQYRSNSDTGIGASDHILDFTSGADKIDLSFIDADTNSGGDQAFIYIGDGAFNGTAGELRVAFDAANDLWRIAGDTNGDGNADFLLLVNSATPAPIAAADFML